MKAFRFHESCRASKYVHWKAFRVTLVRSSDALLNREKRISSWEISDINFALYLQSTKRFAVLKCNENTKSTLVTQCIAHAKVRWTRVHILLISAMRRTYTHFLACVVQTAESDTADRSTTCIWFTFLLFFLLFPSVIWFVSCHYRFRPLYFESCVDGIIVGASNPKHLEANLDALASKEPLDKGTCNEACACGYCRARRPFFRPKCPLLRWRANLTPFQCIFVSHCVHDLNLSHRCISALLHEQCLRKAPRALPKTPHFFCTIAHYISCGTAIAEHCSYFLILNETSRTLALSRLVTSNF